MSKSADNTEWRTAPERIKGVKLGLKNIVYITKYSILHAIYAYTVLLACRILRLIFESVKRLRTRAEHEQQLCSYECGQKTFGADFNKVHTCQVHWCRQRKVTYRHFYHPCPLTLLSTEAEDGNVPGTDARTFLKLGTGSRAWWVDEE